MTPLSAARPVPRIALNRAEVAMAIGFSPDEVDEMVEDGTLPRPRRRGRRKYWLVTEVEAALTDQPYDGETAKPASDDEDWNAD